MFPLLEKIENRAFILPHNFPEIFIIFRGGELPPPHSAGRGPPPPPLGEGTPRGGATIPAS